MRRPLFITLAALGFAVACGGAGCRRVGLNGDPRPNILLVISDDQSWLHTGAAGDSIVKTPSFDRVAESGILFTNAYCAVPSCSPSRASILTGQQSWRLGEAASQLGPIPVDIAVLPDLLEQAGYYVGYTGKGWFPGDFEAGGRTRNPAGPECNQNGQTAYVKNFLSFLDANPDGRPFFFWLGHLDPHFPYNANAYRLEVPNEDIATPPFLPDIPAVRGRLRGYYGEIQRFDDDLGQYLEILTGRGLMEKTLIVVTSDNGIDLPRAKANLYDYGTRMPFALCWTGVVTGGRAATDFVSLTDLAPTFLEAAGVKVPRAMTGRSLARVLLSASSGRVDPTRDRVYFARERHAPARPGATSYPSRAVRTDKFLYIRNFAPDRWPAGDPPYYADIGGGSDLKGAILASRGVDSGTPFFELCLDRRPLEELYDLERDPDQLVNVARDPSYDKARRELWQDLARYLKDTGDPRIYGEDGGWDTMPWTGEWKPIYEHFRPVGTKDTDGG